MFIFEFLFFPLKDKLSDLHWSKTWIYNYYNKFSGMQTPPSSSRSVNPNVMYQYRTHTNIPWNISEYQPFREYLDPNRQKT